MRDYQENEGVAVAEWLSSWLAEQEDRGSIPGLDTWIFRDWLSPASKSRYGWKIAKSTLILKTTNQPTNQENVTTGQTNGRTDRQTPDKVIPMCRYASQATQELNHKTYFVMI